MTKAALVQIIRDTGMTELNALKLADAIYEVTEDKKYPETLATKDDLKNLELRIMEQFKGVLTEMNNQTWKFLLGLSAIATLFKLIEVFQHYK